MWKYIVTWVLTSFISIPCPNSIDEFGRKSIGVCAVYHVETIWEVRKKEFLFKDSALRFYKDSKEESKHSSYIMIGSTMSDVKLDSVFVTPEDEYK